MGSLLEKIKSSYQMSSEEFNQLVQRPPKYQEDSLCYDNEFYATVNCEFTKLFMHISMENFMEKFMQEKLAGISKEEILKLVYETCIFFNQSELPVIQEVSNSNINAQMLSAANDVTQDTLYYNLEELFHIGIATIDAFKMILTHELAHRFFKNQKFYGWNGGAWECELACDFFVGVRSQLEFISSVGMRWALKNSPGSPYHPIGYLRMQIIEFGKKVAYTLSKEVSPIPFDLYLKAYNFFIEKNAEVIFKEQQKIIFVEK